MKDKLLSLALVSVTVMSAVYIIGEVKSWKERKTLYTSIDTLEQRVQNTRQPFQVDVRETQE